MSANKKDKLRSRRVSRPMLTLKVKDWKLDILTKKLLCPIKRTLKLSFPTRWTNLFIDIPKRNGSSSGRIRSTFQILRPVSATPITRPCKSETNW